MNKLAFPDQRRFAFSVFDDTDYGTVENVKPLYDMLSELGIITTKSVWVYPTTNTENPYYHSKTLADLEYLEFIRCLSKRGFEIALHNASMASNKRAVTLSALEKFRELLGYYPNIQVNHHENKENMYWGHDRFDFPILRLLMRAGNRNAASEGHILGSEYFWGDACRKHITYVRNLVFREINLLRVNPTMPYFDPRRPFVNYWFSSAEGSDVKNFNKLLCERNQEKLEIEGGVCIVYTHFGNGFMEKGTINQTTKKVLSELSRRNGWFVPVSTLLDYLRDNQVRDTLSVYERLSMELRWFLGKLLHGTS